MKSGGWVLLDSAETLFLTARDRVFSIMENNKKKGKAGDTDNLFEENPKWTEIGKVIEEIKDELVKDNKDPATETVMIVTRDERTARQVNDFLTLGSQWVLGRMFNKCLGEKFGYLSKYSEDNEPKNIKEFKDKGKGKKSGDKKVDDPIPGTDEMVDSKTPSLVTTFHALDSCESFDTFLMLTQARPGFIILYDCDMTFVRQVEAFQAANTDLEIRVYFLLYKGSVEEQAYLTTLRREKVKPVVLFRTLALYSYSLRSPSRASSWPRLRWLCLKTGRGGTWTTLCWPGAATRPVTSSWGAGAPPPGGAGAARRRAASAPGSLWT